MPVFRYPLLLTPWLLARNAEDASVILTSVFTGVPTGVFEIRPRCQQAEA